MIELVKALLHFGLYANVLSFFENIYQDDNSKFFPFHFLL